MRLSKFTIKVIFLTVLSTMEFIFLYYGDLLLGTSAVPNYIFFKTNTSIFTDGAVESNLAFILLPLSLLGSQIYTTIYLWLVFVVTFLSVSFAVEYFNRVYFDCAVEDPIITAVGIIVSVSLTLSFYYYGGQFFGYSLFIGLVPLYMALLDQTMNLREAFFSKKGLENSILTSLVMALLVVDTRTILYAILLFISFTLFKFLQRISLRRFIHLGSYFIWIFFLFILLNLKFLMGFFMLKSSGIQAIGDIVPVQLFIAYQKYTPIYAFSAAENWLSVYNPSMVLFGLIPFFAGILTLFRKRFPSMAIYLFSLLSLLIIFAVYLSPIINYGLGQTSLYPFLVYTYDTYFFNILYPSLLYIFFAMGILTVLSLISKMPWKKNTIRLIMVIFLVFIIGSQVIYFQPNVQSINQNFRPVPLSNNFVKTADYVYSINPQGNVMILANFSIQNNSYLNFPNAITEDTGWNGWLMSLPSYLLEQNFTMFARAMTYMGVQYIVYNSENYTQPLNLLMHDKGLVLEKRFGQIYVLKNLYFSGSIISNQGAYIAYNIPQTIEFLSLMNKTMPIIPFYDVNNFSKISSYISGFIYPAMSNVTLMELVLNGSNSYEINAGAMNINQEPNGWQIAPIICLGDEINAIAASYQNHAPIVFHPKVPDGYYDVIVQGGVKVGIQYGSSMQTLNFTSGKSNVQAVFNQTVYAPEIQSVNAGILRVQNQTITVQSGKYVDNNYEPFISKIFLIPQKNLNKLDEEVNNFYNEYNIVKFSPDLRQNISFNLNNKNVQNNNFTVIVTFRNEQMGLWTYLQPVTIPGTVFRASYDYGLYNIYISNQKNPEISYMSPYGMDLLIINTMLDLAILGAYVYLRRFSSNEDEERKEKQKRVEEPYVNNQRAIREKIKMGIFNISLFQIVLTLLAIILFTLLYLNYSAIYVVSDLILFFPAMVISRVRDYSLREIIQRFSKKGGTARVK